MQSGFPTTSSGRSIRRLFTVVLRGWILPLALAAAITFPLRSALADWYQVPSGSMRPTILEGDRILVSNLAFGLRVPFTSTWITRWGAPRRGDIVTLASPVDGIRLVKRVIGLPGDHLSMVDNQLRINGQTVAYEAESGVDMQKVGPGRIEHSYQEKECLPGHTHQLDLTADLPSLRSFPEIVIPAGCYFVMGDNRDNSYDSRYFGFVREEKITGRASRVGASFDPDRYYRPRLQRWLKPLV